MATADEDCLHQLQILNAEILKLVALNPELRKKQLHVRAAHLVAETLDKLMTLAELTTDELAARTIVPQNIFTAAVGASFDVSTTWETVAMLAEAAGFRFEIQFTPDMPARLRTGVESNSASSPDSILIRFPSPFKASFAEQTLQSGLEAAVNTRKSQRGVNVRAPIVSRKTPVWELVRLADDCCFELEFRFAFMRNNEQVLKPDVEVYYQFGTSSTSQCDGEQSGVKDFEKGYRN